MSLVRVLCALFVAFASCSEAALSGNHLSDYCAKTQHGYYSEGFCIGFVIGVMNAMTVRDAQERVRGIGGQRRDSLVPRRYCIPEGVTFEHAADAVVSYLNEHPEFHKRPAAELVDYALTGTWPCRSD